MSYEDVTIKSIIDDINGNKIFLPAIQRKLVWKHEQVERLFDSIMRGYPIGTFLFWKLDRTNANKYTFYKFIQEYKHDLTVNEVAPSPFSRDEIIGVLDGQQRLNSMYIALQGSYAYKKPRVWRKNPGAYPRRNLYLNLLYQNDTYAVGECGECGEEVPFDSEICPNCGIDFKIVDADIHYQFKFLREEEAKEISRDTFWFPVKEVFSWEDLNDLDDFFDELKDSNEKVKGIFKNKERKKIFKSNLIRLWESMNKDKIISYFEIEEQELDNILAIFVRVNSGGTILSKSDLLFSTIVANWEEARDEIEKLIKVINNKGDGFRFSNDFIMRCCLLLTDCPAVFKVQTFKKENVAKIRQEWKDISAAINKSVDLLVEFGFSDENLTSQMSVIPIAYFFKKKGTPYRPTKKEKEEMKIYLIKSLLKQIYGGQGDQIVGKIRDAMRKSDGSRGYVLKSDSFTFSGIENVSLPSGKSLSFSDIDIEKILEHEKGPYTFMVLSLLYPDLKLGQIKFHQDHIHPDSGFRDKQLEKARIQKDKREKWQNIKDTLPNLQLLEGSENESKKAKPFKDWFNGADSQGQPNVPDKKGFIRTNYIPKNESMEFKNFEKFYSQRRGLLAKKLKTALK